MTKCCKLFVGVCASINLAYVGATMTLLLMEDASIKDCVVAAFFVSMLGFVSYCICFDLYDLTQDLPQATRIDKEKVDWKHEGF